MATDSFVNRALSFIFPIILEKCDGEKGHELEVTLENGRIVLNSATANYSFGSLHKVWTKALGGIDLKNTDKILVLGGGVGSVPSIVHNKLDRKAHITMVEHDSEVIRLGNEYFGLQNSDRIKIEHQDAFAFCQRVDGLSYDLILIDLFSDLNIPDEVSKTTFWNDLDKHLNSNGIIMLNTIIHDRSSRALVEKLMGFISEKYSNVQELALFDINHVFIIRTSHSKV